MGKHVCKAGDTLYEILNDLRKLEGRIEKIVFQKGEPFTGKIQRAKYVWMSLESDNPCDIRRYAFSHQQGVDMVEYSRGWGLFKLVRVNGKKGNVK